MFQTLALSILVLFASVAAAAADKAGDIAEGKRLAGLNCANCHALGLTGESTLVAAPAFRDISRNYDEGELEDAFNDGIVTSHPAMPDWEMSSDQARQLAAFIMSFPDGP